MELMGYNPIGNSNRDVFGGNDGGVYVIRNRDMR